VTVRAYHGLEQVPGDLGPTVVTVGMFDGVHRGHLALLGRVTGEAAARGVPAAAVTFDRHPMEVLRPGSHPLLLTTLRQKVALLGEAGVAVVLVLPFTLELSQVPAREFATRVLFEVMGARAVVVGANFRFGHKAQGDVELLEALGRERGVDAVGVALHADDGREAVSSTRIRAELARGDVQAAARLLGRAYAVEGQVNRGDGRGRTLGVPTANVGVPDRIALPAMGVYAGHLDPGDGGRLPAVTNVGVSPQFGGTQLRVEAHVLDYDADLYGRRVSVSFEHRLRGEEVFAGVDELVAQMQEDIRQSRKLLGTPARP
jgi:riboflavin kinase / FMN adenylyltransferase